MPEKSQYKTLSEWRESNKSIYESARKRGFLNEICEHFGWERKKNLLGQWGNKENCLVEARKYKSVSEWQKNSGGSYSSALKNGWYYEIVNILNLKRGRKINGYWTKERCVKNASGYDSIGDWRTSGNGGAYFSARENNWLDECTGHMIYDKKPSKHWTKKTVLTEARKFSFKNEWAKKSSGSYDKACTNGWLYECTAHMIEIRKPKGYWTKEKIIAEARKYNSLIEWQNNSNTSITKARKIKIYGECITHMVIGKKPNGYWTKEKVIAEARKYKSRTEWQKNSFTTYNKALKLGIMNECTKHMK